MQFGGLPVPIRPGDTCSRPANAYGQLGIVLPCCVPHCLAFAAGPVRVIVCAHAFIQIHIHMKTYLLDRKKGTCSIARYTYAYLDLAGI
jgi:hypothetical protein